MMLFVVPISVLYSAAHDVSRAGRCCLPTAGMACRGGVLWQLFKVQVAGGDQQQLPNSPNEFELVSIHDHGP